MWINYKDEIKNVSDKIINEYVNQIDIMINLMKKSLFGIDGKLEKIFIDIINKAKNNNTLQNQLFINKFIEYDRVKVLIDNLELKLYETSLEISKILLEQHKLDFINIIKKQNLSNIGKKRLLSDSITDNANLLEEFSKIASFEFGLEIAETMDHMKLSYITNFIKNNENFFIKYREKEYVIGLTEVGLKKFLKEVNDISVTTTREESILTIEKFSYYLEEKEKEIINKNIIHYYVSSYKLLNKMAYEKGFNLDRVSGSHGIFKNTCGKIIIIPQGRIIGRGLSFKIQQDIHDVC